MSEAPVDHIAPDWQSAGSVHEWMNYISEEVQQMWDTFTPEQKAAIARNASEQASRENWD